MKGCKPACLLVALVAATTGCRASTGEPDSNQVAAREESAVPARLPEALTGVWYPDDTEGAASCQRYRTLSGAKEGHDEAVMALVGSLVVTPDLIHVFAEYGEGDFHVLERVDPEGGGTWRVDARLGIDALPDERASEDRAVSRLSLHDGKLRWESPARAGNASTYFRCGSVKSDIRPATSQETRYGPTIISPYRSNYRLSRAASPTIHGGREGGRTGCRSVPFGCPWSLHRPVR